MYSLDETDLHLKYMLVESEYGEGDDARWRELVWTGSHNFNGPSLHSNDEVLMRIDDQPVYDRFAENFQTVHHLAVTGEYPELDCDDTVTVGGVDSGVDEREVGAADFVGVGFNGSCVADLIHDDVDWPSKGRFMRHVNDVLRELEASDVIADDDAGRIRAAAARSDVGRS